MLQKLNLVQAHKAEYAQPTAPALVHVGPGLYLAIDGEGDPNGPGFQEAVGALYPVAWTLKMRKKRDGTDYAVAPLEGLWSNTAAGALELDRPRDDWRWTALIRTPDFITDEDLAQAVVELERKQAGGRAISASEVRRRLREDDFEGMAALAPPATVALLREKYQDPEARRPPGTG